MKKILGGIALSALLAAPAIAADIPARIPVKAPPPVAVTSYNWSGCYLGVHGGGKWGKSEQIADSGALAGSSMTGSYDIDGGLFGGQVGCNFQSGAWVFGIEGDGSWTNADGGSNLIAPFNPAFFASTEEKWLATVRGRLGYAAGNWLLYVTGGGAFASVEIRSVLTATPTTFREESKTLSGWTVGAGAEWGLAGGWSVKAEYLYVDLGDKRFFVPADITFVTRRADAQQHIARVGLNWRWGAGPVVARY